MKSIINKIRHLKRSILNRYKFKRLRRLKIWIKNQLACLEHKYYVSQDKSLCKRVRYQLPEIKNTEETLTYLIDNSCSIARFGDGELGFIFGKGIGFQKYDKDLATRLEEVLRYNGSNRLLIGLSEWIFYSDYGKYPEYRVQYLRKILNLLIPGKTYYSADISRFYKSASNEHKTLHQISLLRKIWDGRNVTLIEGEKSRMGVGNDLLDNAKSIKRILCPAVNAFLYYSDILHCAVELIPQNELILIALGPTATVLAYDLFLSGYQAIDIGHADISYEWFLRDVKDPSGRVAITGKYVNEVGGGDQVVDIIDANYTKQIVARIGID